jgi:hypothetical protein
VKSGWLALTALLWASASWAGWPEIPSPPNARIENIGDHVRLNGVPMRMQRVLSNDKAANIIAFYRQALGSKHAEENMPDGRLLAQGRGDYFLTVRVKALGPSYTETLVSVSDARAAKNAAGRALGFQLPSRSQLVSDMESTDDGKVSRQLVFLNDLPINTNVDFLTKTLQARGYKPQTEGYRSNASEHVLMFGGTRREARLVVVRKAGVSNVVLTTILMP